VPLTLIKSAGTGLAAIGGKLASVIKVPALARVVVRTSCDGGKARPLFRFA
jgi:hypothetical protein